MNTATPSDSEAISTNSIQARLKLLSLIQSLGAVWAGNYRLMSSSYMSNIDTAYNFMLAIQTKVS